MLFCASHAQASTATEATLMGIPLRLLLIEDSAGDVELLVRELRRGGYEPVYQQVDTAAEMKAALDRRSWDLVVSDHSVPQFDAFAALDLLKASGLDVPFIVVSGTIDEERAVQAMKAGASDYVLKGNLTRLVPALARELSDAEGRRARRTAEHALHEGRQQAALELATAYDATIEGWARALDLRDQETEGHSRRVADLTLRLARRLGVSEAEQVHLRRGALLHDIGKMGIPDAVLLKPSALTHDERDIMRRHPAYARNFLAPIAYLAPALDIPYGHHEKWDGTGYPGGLKGNDIPLAARLFAPIDIWDAVQSDRPYRAAWSAEQAHQLIASLAGTHLDPEIVRVFLDIVAPVDSRARARERAAGATHGRMSGRILVVDDMAANVALLQRWLSGDGYEVVTAESGEAALAGVVLQRPDLVLLDLMMPPPDGLAVCRRLKDDRATREIPIVFLTGRHDFAFADGWRDAGADDCLTKPVDGHELRTVIRRVLRRVRGVAPVDVVAADGLRPMRLQP